MNQHPNFATLLTTHLSRADERSAAWLARRLDVHPSTVTKWLNGDSRPSSPEKVILAAELLGVSDPAERKQLLLTAGFGYWVPTPLAGATRELPTDQPEPQQDKTESTPGATQEEAPPGRVEKGEVNLWGKWVKGVAKLIGR